MSKNSRRLNGRSESKTFKITAIWCDLVRCGPNGKGSWPTKAESGTTWKYVEVVPTSGVVDWWHSFRVRRLCFWDVSRGIALAQPLAAMRRLDLNLLKREKTKKRRIRGKMLNASWDHSYLVRLLGVQPEGI